LILRQRSHVFINLFAMMLSTGIPELSSVTDLLYLREAFMLGMYEAKAAEAFSRMIFDSLNDRLRRFDNMVHIIVHKTMG